jgi:hypothetical protein
MQDAAIFHDIAHYVSLYQQQQGQGDVRRPILTILLAGSDCSGIGACALHKCIGARDHNILFSRALFCGHCFVDRNGLMHVMVRISCGVCFSRLFGVVQYVTTARVIHCARKWKG